MSLKTHNLGEKEMHDSSNELPRPTEIRKAVKTYLDGPVVFKNTKHSAVWIEFPKSIEDFVKMFGDVKFDFRIVRNSSKEISWEGDAHYLEASILQFNDWQHGIAAPDNPFYKFEKDKYWAYSSYNYMNVAFSKKPEALQDIHWGHFGFPEITGKDSTFWLGSAGANTPCHVDSYGCNLVAQVFGRKKWVLFPPEDTKFLYPTRIPYEESSVFSSVNVANPDIEKHPLYKQAHPHVVILEKNEVLYVPKGWWHFVTNLDPITASINAWIKLESDSSSRLSESATKFIMNALITSYEPEGQEWLNPKENLISPDETLSYIISTLRELKRSFNSPNSRIQDSKSKISKLKRESDVHSEQCKENLFKYGNVVSVKPSSVLELCDDKPKNSPEKLVTSHKLTVEKIANCFVHPDVINLVCQLLKEI